MVEPNPSETGCKTSHARSRSSAIDRLRNNSRNLARYRDLSTPLANHRASVHQAPWLPRVGPTPGPRWCARWPRRSTGPCVWWCGQPLNEAAKTLKHTLEVCKRTQPKQNLASEAMTPAFDAWLWIWMHGFFWPGVLCCNVVPSV